LDGTTVDPYLERLTELLRSDLSPDGVSGIIARTYDARMTEGDTGSELASAQLSYPDFLTITFNVNSTRGDTEQATPTGASLPNNGQYSVTVRFENVGGVVPEDLKSLPQQNATQILKQAFDQCDVKVNCNCHHFLFGGAWEDLAKKGGSSMKFMSTKGTGVWRKRHARSGGLKDPYVRVCKHLAQVLDELEQYIPEILKKL
jgi:hypothetical protein